MRIAASGATLQGDGDANEDRFAYGPTWAFVLDGAGPYPGQDYGCHHSTVWLVDRLAEHLADGLNRCVPKLADLLAEAIDATRRSHEDTCDVDHPLALGATVAIMRYQDPQVEWLVLGDTACVIEYTDGVLAIIDDRVDRLDGPVTDAPVRTYAPEFVRSKRNAPDGFWVAGSVPEAARHAYTGQIIGEYVRGGLLCTDGVTRLVDRYHWSWEQALQATRTDGVSALLSKVRQEENQETNPRRWRGKQHDDATAIDWTLSAPALEDIRRSV